MRQSSNQTPEVLSLAEITERIKVLEVQEKSKVDHVAKLSDEEKILNDRIIAKEQKIFELDGLVKARSSELSSAEVERGALLKELSNITGKISEAKAEAERKISQLGQDFAQKMADLQLEEQDVLAKIQKHKEEVDALTKQIGAQQKEWELKEAEIKSVLWRLQDTLVQVTLCEEKIQDLKNQIANKNVELASLEVKVEKAKDIEQTISALSSEAASAQETLRLVKESISKAEKELGEVTTKRDETILEIREKQEVLSIAEKKLEVKIKKFEQMVIENKAEKILEDNKIN